jgi:Fe-S-cluster containining protein
MAEPAWPSGLSDQPEQIDANVHCDACQACCCRKEVLLLDDPQVPGHFVDLDAWGGEVMRRLDDGWCAALDRQQLRCLIYSLRPQLCREVAMGGAECLEARAEVPGRP